MGAEIGFVNQHGLRLDFVLDEGKDRREMTLSDIYTMFPFDNKIYCYNLSWGDLLQVLQYSMTEQGRDLFSHIIGADVYYTDRTIHGVVTSAGLPIYVDGQWREGWKGKTVRVAISEYLATTNRVSDGLANPFIAWNETSRLIEHEKIDNLGASAVLSAEAEANGGHLAIDTTAHFINSAFHDALSDKADPPASVSGLTAAMKPAAQTGLVYTGRQQALVIAPASPAPETYTPQYSIDGGKTWTDSVPTAEQAGSYTVQVKYVSPVYADLVMPPIAVTIQPGGSESHRSSHAGGSSSTPPSVEPALPFADVSPEGSAYDGIKYVYEKGIINGVSATEFAPDSTLSRAMAVTMLHRMEGEPTVAAGGLFEDVAAGKWYTDAVLWASEQGIVEGYGNGRFGPNDRITRQQLAVILYRYAQSKGQGFAGAWMFPLDYPDASEVSGWADEAMHWMVMNGVINGKDGKLVPKGEATRAEAAIMVQRFCPCLE